MLDELGGGVNFAALAQQSSEDISTAANGGDLGWFARGRMLPEFENIAFSLAFDRSMILKYPTSSRVSSRSGYAWAAGTA